MKIPTTEVIFKPEQFTEKDGSYDWSSYRLYQIQLRPSTATHPITEAQLEQTFYHELMYFILYYAGASYSVKADYMHQDEGFVETCANLLHQELSTFEYDKKEVL